MMEISDELRKRIGFFLEDNDILKNRILNGEADAIKEIGCMSYKAIDPLDIVESVENNTVDNLYKQAKKTLGLRQLYQDLIKVYSEQHSANESKKHI